MNSTSENNELTKALLVAIFKDLEKDLVGKVSFKELCVKSGISKFKIEGKFGSIDNFYHYAKNSGLSLPFMESTRKVYTKNSLSEIYFIFKKENGRRPTPKEFKPIGCHFRVLEKLFGKPGWGNFLKYLGEKKLTKKFKYSEESLILDCKKLYKKLNRPFKMDEFCKEYKVSASPIGTTFKTWENLLKKSDVISFGEYEAQNKITHLIKWCEKRGNLPSMHSKDAYVRKMKSRLEQYRKDSRIQELIENYPSAGEITNKKKRIESISLIKKWLKSNKYIPSEFSKNKEDRKMCGLIRHRKDWPELKDFIKKYPFSTQLELDIKVKDKIESIELWCDRFGYLPNQCSKNLEEQQSGRLLNYLKVHYKNNLELIKLLNKHSSYNEYCHDQAIIELREYCLKNGAPRRRENSLMYTRFFKVINGKYGKERQIEFNRFRSLKEK